MRRTGPAAALFVALFVAGPRAEAEVGPSPGPTEIRESFDRLQFNRELWSIDPNNPHGLRADLTGDALRLVIPPGRAGRPPAAFSSRFQLEGDFAVQVDYRIRSMPRPEKDWTNLEIQVEGADGAAAIIRTNHAKEGMGHVLWFEPSKGSDRPGQWRQLPTQATAGTLRLERTGGRLHYTAIRPGGRPETLGVVDFGTGRIDRLHFRVVASESRSAVDVSLDDIRVDADRVVLPPPPAEFWARRQLAWLAPIAAAGAAAAGSAWFLLIRPGSARSARPAGSLRSGGARG